MKMGEIKLFQVKERMGKEKLAGGNIYVCKSRVV
jgi:hypothetical protein